MECKFFVGQRVVCIKGFAGWDKIYPGLVFPEKDKIYTIRAINVAPDRDGVEGIGLRFVEITNKPHIDENGSEGEASFDYEDFRPVETRKTDISIFTNMLRQDALYF